MSAPRGAVVTGIGVMTGFGSGVSTFANALFAARSATRCESIDLGDGERMHPSATAPDSETTAALAKAAGIGAGARATQLALLAAREAWTQAGFAPDVDRDRIGLIIGRSFAPQEIIGTVKRTLWERGPSAVSALQFVQTISNSALGRVALDFKLRGPSMMHFGGNPLGPALEDLRLGRADAMLAGACEEVSQYVRFLCDHQSLEARCARDGEGARPYDDERDGLVPADGAAFVILEREDRARERGARVLARLEGYSCITDRRATRVATERDVDDVGESVRRALRDAGRHASDVAFASGSASGVRGDASLDVIEPRALGESLARTIPLFSHKGAAGESWGVAGLLSAIAAIVALDDGRVPPTAGTLHARGDGAHVVTSTPIKFDGSVALALALDLMGEDSTYVFASAS